MANKYLDGNSLLAIRTYIANSIASAISTVYKFKGSKTVAQVNGTADSGNIDYTTIATGDVYNISDSGTITKPTGTSLVVVAGDNIVWTGDTWDKLAGDIDLSGYVTLATDQTITGLKTIGHIKAGGTYSSVAYAYFDIQFGSGAAGGELAFKWDNVNKNITLDNNSGSLILMAEEKVYYGGETSGKEIVVKENIVAYTEQEALAILQSGSLS